MACHGAPGGWVSSCGYCVVVSFMISVGDPPNAPTCGGLEPSATAWRPDLAIPASTAGIVDDGAFGDTHATGTPHIPLITWLNAAAICRSTISTADERPIDAHRLRTASASCSPTRCCAMPPAVGWRPPPVPACVRPKPNEVLTDGSSIAPTQNAPTTTAVVLPAPRSLARLLSHAAAQ